MSEPIPLIQLTSLSKTFNSKAGQLSVLRDIDLAVNRGESVAIVGKSGSGKSTLLSIIGLLDDASSGAYHLCDTEVTTLSHYQTSILRNQNIGWVFQNFNLVSSLTVQKNVEMPLRYNKNISKSDYQNMALTQLKLVGLEDKAQSYPDQLSGGQQQRVAIARALISNPDVLLCDEPTGNLDSENSDQIINLLLKLNQNGTTLLMVTHDMNLAQRCRRVIEIKDGTVI
ncbi:ABC transporter ATP-binding protein [Thalassotalea marina]|uniref:Macrolide ABC transporter ATP-binding protein n=1 Tax=Thalassotalea marina TaxID=1673741 RepID=A0A919EGQ0_9GAMM|nr:ABC transporter ATP-binding protein [Thalassotalea marina]GHF77684.1 macrolide ABC transporter ATP-binding protein [Thalassotalea marina]